MALHGVRVSKMVALTICRGRLTGRLLTPLVAWMLRWMVDDLWVQGANMRFITLLGTKSFYEHYRIGGTGESPVAEDEQKGGGVNHRVCRSHSPFGIVWQIAAATGWSRDHILWKVNYQTLRMMLADAPHYERRRKGKPDCKGKGVKPKSVAGFFQTRLHDK